MKLFKNEENGKKMQVEVIGDMNKVFNFISSYKGV